MKLWLSVVFVLTNAPGCREVQAPSPERRGAVTAFIGVDVVPMDRERVLPNQTVLIESGRIVELGPAAEVDVPERAVRIDANGKYLMPGLAEMHGHLPSPDMPEEVTENVLFLYVANGVTTVRGMQGNTSQIALRERIEQGDLVGPRLVLGSPSMAGGRVPTVSDAERLVREYKDAGFDLLKVHEELSAEVYDAIARTAREVDIPFGGHVTDKVGLFHALSAGQTTIDHLDNYVEALVPGKKAPGEAPGLRGAHELLALVDESRIDEVVRATVEADASVVPTMVLWERGIYATRPSSELLEEQKIELKYMPKDMVARWVEAVDERVSTADVAELESLAALRRRILTALHRGGARVLLGTDSPQIFSVPGFSIHREMALYVEVGLSPFDVLASGTRVVGDYLGVPRGRVEVGQQADLLLLDGNPLESVGHAARPAGVMVRGRYFSRKDIDKKLEAIATYYGI
jgi:imidazolonepropionase-like amidohydrolase